MKFYIYTLGCKVNSYESQVMHDAFLNAGYQEGEIHDADIVVVNTCSVTNTADHKSLKTIRQARKNNPQAILIVVGCFAQNKGEDLLKLEDVDLVLGNVGKASLVSYLAKFQKTKQREAWVRNVQHLSFEPMTLNNFDHTRAFVKIQDGCNNYCSYCIIPYLRGNVRSKNVHDVVVEVQTLVQKGHHEIVLTGIHTGNYGREQGTSLASLLQELVKIENLQRIRISSIEVTELDDAFLDMIKTSPIIVDHLHIPLQSGSNTVLKRMNRKYDKAYFEEKICLLRQIRPNISITTDVIVGFPGETDQEFLETLDTIDRIDFTKIHVFPYSKRQGTKAADMVDQIDEKVKKNRVKILIEKSNCLEKNYAKRFIGKTLDVIVETYKNGFLYGHTGNYLQVKFEGNDTLLHQTVLVEIEKNEQAILIGKRL